MCKRGADILLKLKSVNEVLIYYNYWLNDNKNEAGTCWIISKKGSGLFSNDKQCGFIAFEFRDTLKNARISYAIVPNHRKKGIASKAVTLVINKLKDCGIERIEADIDRDNYNSEKVVEKLGFTANKKEALVDPEMFRDGEIRMRALWTIGWRNSLTAVPYPCMEWYLPL